MISGGEISGKNFLMKETFEYAKKRVKNRKDNETIDEFRLFNNLLSSMPMAFNLFHPLMLLLEENPEKVTLAIRSIFKNIPVFVVTKSDWNLYRHQLRNTQKISRPWMLYPISR
mgnify:CR=1 FL=1